MIQNELQQSIAEQGQQVPILVRPHPETPGRYQVAYGHRRLQAAISLGRKVKAVVRPLTNDELVVAQGVENSARANLSFIERAVYAARLEEAGFSRPTIMAALAVDKTALSKLIAVPARIPMALLLAIGAAPKIGRDRWLEFADKIEAMRDASPLAALAEEPASWPSHRTIVSKGHSRRPACPERPLLSLGQPTGRMRPASASVR